MDAEPVPLDNVRVVKLPVHVDVANAMDVRAELDDQLQTGVTVLVADLSATVSLSLEGLQALLLVRAAAVRKGAAFRLAAVERRVRRSIILTGSGRLFSLYDSVDDAKNLPAAQQQPSALE